LTGGDVTSKPQVDAGLVYTLDVSAMYQHDGRRSIIESDATLNRTINLLPIGLLNNTCRWLWRLCMY
jgi:hypothetical protein